MVFWTSTDNVDFGQVYCTTNAYMYKQNENCELCRNSMKAVEVEMPGTYIKV